MRITRREALGLLLAPVAAAGCGPIVQPAHHPVGNQRPQRALVIGAGISGIQAARDLNQAGFRVTIIESRDRVGGRIWTDRSLGAPLDLGASWIHGIRKNPIHSLARRQGFELYKWDYEKMAVYDPMGRRVELGGELDRLVWEFYRRARRLLRQNPQASIQDFIDAAIEDGTVDDLSKPRLDFLINTVIEQDVAADADRVSAATLLEEGELGGGDVVFPDGYDVLVRPLARGLEIRLNQSVRKISFDAGGVSVETDKEHHQADYAVLSVPLGVLKAGVILFEPELPALKQRAIEAMEMGLLNKTCLRFPRVFWDQDFPNLGHIDERKGAWAYWVNVAIYSGEPILAGLNAASFGAELESWGDEAIVADAMAALRTMYGNRIPEPVGHLTTRWRKDPFSLGSYSFVPTSARYDMRADLASPVGDRLFFAGEATHTKYPATVHGAYLSGKRAAREVVSMHKRATDVVVLRSA